MIYIAPILGLLAGVVGIADTIPYVRDTVRGSTRPHRGTWLIWDVLAIVDRGVPVAAGRRRVVEPDHGRRAGRPHQRRLPALDPPLRERTEAGRHLHDHPGGRRRDRMDRRRRARHRHRVRRRYRPDRGSHEVPKTYRDPGSETLATFALASLSGALAAGAVGAPDPSLLLYPVYYFLANRAIAILIYYRRKLLANLQRTSSPARSLRPGPPDTAARTR